MPQNGYSIGRDVSLDIIDPNQGVVRFDIKTGWNAKQLTEDVKVKRLDGVVDNLYLPQGWELSFEIERSGASVDTYFANLEANYYAGVNGQPATVTETITEPNGAVSQYRYQGVVLKLDDAGDWKGDATVKPKVRGMASKRIKVA